jgi:hypothetical protein
MNRILRHVAVLGAGASMLTCAATVEANAYYLGYGNGDPGNWDFWTEQNGGPQHGDLGHTKHVRHVFAPHHQGMKQKPSDQTHS